MNGILLSLPSSFLTILSLIRPVGRTIFLGEGKRRVKKERQEGWNMKARLTVRLEAAFCLRMRRVSNVFTDTTVQVHIWTGGIISYQYWVTLKQMLLQWGWREKVEGGEERAAGHRKSCNAADAFPGYVLPLLYYSNNNIQLAMQREHAAFARQTGQRLGKLFTGCHTAQAGNT